MAGMKRPVLSQPWEEDECLEYYGMLSLHRMFDVIGSQLTDSDIEALSFLLHESYPYAHPLDPQSWAVEDESGTVPDSSLVAAWQRWHRRAGPLDENSNLESSELLRPKNGTELLLELERRGKCDESNFTHLLQLLRVLTRHDLMPYVTMKRPRTVSPERYTYGPSVLDSDKQMDGCLNQTTSESREDNWETGSNSTKRKRGATGRRGRCPKPKKNKVDSSASPPPAQTTQNKVTCGIRLRVRAEYCQHDSILNQNVLSIKQNPLERRFDLFSQSNTVLKSRDLGSIICDIKFSELSYLDAFWTDYMNGSLLEALKGVFITDSLKQAVGQERIQLLVNVDEDDYEEGRRLLLESVPQSSD
ncbi:DNA-binding death effector domain-containing protein 2 [Spea bombifrons]|uniref:DNA-binding death effector domain-containing protein 2 n=1 Tax=Spea bombifrons TaxID=233779 RepID=UPI00234945F0|nr:DNA-binding death effector domain-containing protein 2 [Spea bombifrons]